MSWRYNTTVTSAREKVYIRLCAQKRNGAIWLAVIHIKIIEGKPNMALIYPKLNAECRDSVFDGQINY